ncbi:unnamed protein product, partial [Mesorhabditis belari]|uniref:RNase H type-1 domain-containing protein n=1 Tax=Mesorhabditis belari TaxID=2138241 RepID=A0AAF3ESK1_9BILA
MLVYQLHLLGVLLILTTNEASAAQKECTKGFPFACFVHLWENENNAGKEFVHAFNTETFFEAYCKDVEKCNSDCRTTGAIVNKSDVRNKGFVFRCNPRNLFCNEKKNVECIPIRKVYRLSEKGVASQSQPAPQEPIEKTSKETKTTTQESLPALPDVNRQFALHKRDNRRKRKVPPAPVPSNGDSFVPNLVEIQTIVLPICRREDTEKDCMALTSGRFCTIKEAVIRYPSHQYLPWSDIKDICTVVESPLGGESPKWFAEHVENKKENLGSMEVVWEYTGFPFDIVTNKSSPFLAHRFDYGTKKCRKYAENTENCLPLPICDDGKHFITHRIRMRNVVNPNDVNHLRFGESTLDNPCRILDIEHLPLHRQNSPPYAKFATLAANLQRRKFGLTGRNEMPHMPEVTTEKAPLARRDAANIPTRYYGRPIDLETVNEEDRAAIESNYWLSTNRNAFYKKYGDKIKLAKASMCTSDSKETFCRSPPTTPNPNANNTCHNSTTTAKVEQESSSLPWWTILLIVLAGLTVTWFVVLLVWWKGCFGLSEERKTTRGGKEKRKIFPSRQARKKSKSWAKGTTFTVSSLSGDSSHSTPPAQDRTSETKFVVRNLEDCFSQAISKTLQERAELWEKKKDEKELAERFGFPTKWRSKDCHQQFNKGNIYIYTDGSRANDKTGTTGIGTFYGIGHPLNLGLNIGPTDHAFFGELLAINVALHRLLLWGGFGNRDVILRTDCVNVIIALKNEEDRKLNQPLIDKDQPLGWTLNRDEKKPVKNLHFLLKRFPKVTMQWVPSHVGDAGNDHADALAHYGRCGSVKHWKPDVDDVKKRELGSKFWHSRNDTNITFENRNVDQTSRPEEVAYPEDGAIQKILKKQEIQIDIIREINKKQ